MTLITSFLAFSSSSYNAFYKGKAYPTIAVSKNDIDRFADFFGLDLDSDTEKSQKITIPCTFNKLYKNYNLLQNTVGLNLTQYAGKECMMYSYEIMNKNSSPDSKLRILVYDGHIIGGDICYIEYSSEIRNFAGKTLSEENILEQ